MVSTVTAPERLIDCVELMNGRGNVLPLMSAYLAEDLHQLSLHQLVRKSLFKAKIRTLMQLNILR